jgi:hypothetical protein
MAGPSFRTRVTAAWSLWRAARRGELGPGFNSRSDDVANLAQKLAALRLDEPDDTLAEEIRPLLRRKGAKTSEVLWLLQDPTGELEEIYERARRLVELAAAETPKK